jgi:hypothetical protein
MRLGSAGGILDNSLLKSASAVKRHKTTSTDKVEKQDLAQSLQYQGVFKQMLIGYVTGATNDYDRGFDAVSFNGNSFVDFIALITTSF